MREIKITKDDKLLCDICRNVIGDYVTECLQCGGLFCEQDYIIDSNKRCSKCKAPASYMRSAQNTRIQRTLIQSRRDARLNDANERNRFDNTPNRDGRKLSPPSDSFIHSTGQMLEDTETE